MKTLICSISLLCVAQFAMARTVQVDGPRIRLSDLVKGVANDFIVVDAPLPGSRRTISRRQVLALGDFSGRKLPQSWTVVTRQQTLGCSEFRSQVRASLKNKLSDGLRVITVTCTRQLVLPKGKIRLEARLIGRGRRAGRLSTKVTVSVPGWKDQVKVVAVEVDGRLSVVVANGDQGHGTVLRPSDFRLEQRLASAVSTDAITSLSELKGFKSNTRISRDSVVRKRMLRAIPLVRRGSSVTISVLMNGLRLSSRGVVRQDAGRGEMVSVLALNSRKLLRARVVDARTVAVEL
jgi:flagellar basal body P-ring formation protein FlgA